MMTINPLLPEEIQTLAEMHKNHPCHAPRIKAHVILLSDAGFKFTEIAGIYNICRQTLATWLYSWKEGGICAMLDKPRNGRPYSLFDEAEIYAPHTRINQSKIIKKLWLN